MVQRRVFVACKSRLDDGKLYIRNAVGNPAHKHDKEKRNSEIAKLHDLLKEYKPPLVLPFGQFAFEFALPALQEEKKRARSWKVWRVGGPPFRAEQWCSAGSAPRPPVARSGAWTANTATGSRRRVPARPWCGTVANSGGGSTWGYPELQARARKAGIWCPADAAPVKERLLVCEGWRGGWRNGTSTVRAMRAAMAGSAVSPR